MIRMLRLSRQYTGANGCTQWTSVRIELEKTCSKHAPDFLSFQKYIQMWAGGADAFFLKELQKFWAARVPPGRSVPAAFWTALSELQCDANELCPRVVTAIVEAQATCREQNVLGGVCKLYSASDIKALNTKMWNEIRQSIS